LGLFATTEEIMSVLNLAVQHWDDIAAVTTLVGGWLWNKAHHRKTESLKDMLLSLGRQVVPKLLADARLYDDAWVRSRLRDYMVDGLTRLKVPMTPTVSGLVDEAVEHIHGELAEKLTAYHLDEFIKVQGKTAELLK
jgi:hypothetical protein